MNLISPYSSIGNLPLCEAPILFDWSEPAQTDEENLLSVSEQACLVDDTCLDTGTWQLAHRNPKFIHDMAAQVHWLTQRRATPIETIPEPTQKRTPLYASVAEYSTSASDTITINPFRTDITEFSLAAPSHTEIRSRLASTEEYSLLVRFVNRIKDQGALQLKRTDQNLIRQVMIIYHAHSLEEAMQRLEEHELIIPDMDDSLMHFVKKTCQKFMGSFDDMETDSASIQFVLPLRNPFRHAELRDLQTALLNLRALRLACIDETVTPRLYDLYTQTRELTLFMFNHVQARCAEIHASPALDQIFPTIEEGKGYANALRVSINLIVKSNGITEPEIQARIPAFVETLEQAEQAILDLYGLNLEDEDTDEAPLPIEEFKRPIGPALPPYPLRSLGQSLPVQIHLLMNTFGIIPTRVQIFQNRILPRLTNKTLEQILELYDRLTTYKAKRALLRMLCPLHHTRHRDIAFAIDVIYRFQDKFERLESFIIKYQHANDATLKKPRNGFHFELRVIKALDNLGYVEIIHIGKIYSGREIDITIRIGDRFILVESKLSVSKGYTEATWAQIQDQIGTCAEIDHGYLVITNHDDSLNRDLVSLLDDNHIAHLDLDHFDDLNQEKITQLAG